MKDDERDMIDRLSDYSETDGPQPSSELFAGYIDTMSRYLDALSERDTMIPATRHYRRYPRFQGGDEG